MLVNVKYGRQQNQLPVYVVKGNRPSWKRASVSDSQATRSLIDNWKQKVEAILDTHKNVFKDELGKINIYI